MGRGSVADPSHQRDLFRMVGTRGFEPVSAIHARATISPSAHLGRGIALMAGTIMNSGVVVEEDVIVNTGAIVEHDCIIENHVHLATSSPLAGGVGWARTCILERAHWSGKV